jgi:tripartite-type tricarboxylate transporter receptor subunit TctC
MTEPQKIRRALLLAAALTAVGPAALAADFPSKPIKLVVPYGAGGTIDIVGRMLGPKLGALLGQTVIIDNKPGAGTMIGANEVARAEPDGHTLFLGSNSAFTISPHAMSKVPYDPVRSFAAVGTLASFPNMVLVPPSSPYQTLGDLVQAARANPGKLSYASFGIASTGELAGEAIKVAAGLDITEIPYKSGAQSVQAILAKEVNFGFDTAIGSVQRVKSGQLRALAVTSRERLPSLPDVPSVVELGFPDADVVAWIALFAPAATPEATQKKLDAAFQSLVKDPEVKKQLADLGIDLSYLSGEATMQMMRSEYVRFGKLIEKAKIRAE